MYLWYFETNEVEVCHKWKVVHIFNNQITYYQSTSKKPVHANS